MALASKAKLAVVHHVEGKFQLFDSAAGGQVASVESGFRPRHRVYQNYLAIARHEYPDVEQLSPGASARVHAWFVKPEIYPQSLWEGRTIEVLEGDRLIGLLTITKVLNPVLAGSAQAYTPQWIAPPPVPPRPERSYAGLVFMGFLYLVFSGLMLSKAIEAYTPCVSNFEGGCGMGKAMVALESCFIAIVVFALGLAVRALLLTKATTRPFASKAGIFLIGLPLVYGLFTLQAIFFG